MTFPLENLIFQLFTHTKMAPQGGLMTGNIIPVSFFFLFFTLVLISFDSWPALDFLFSSGRPSAGM